MNIYGNLIIRVTVITLRNYKPCVTTHTVRRVNCVTYDEATAMVKEHREACPGAVNYEYIFQPEASRL